MNNYYREIIFSIVNSSQGIKAVDLALKVMSEINPTRFNHDEYITKLGELVKQKEVVELEYILPQLNFRLKSIYFPKGTKIGKETKG